MGYKRFSVNQKSFVETLALAVNRHFDEEAAAKEPTELFTKNTGLC